MFCGQPTVNETVAEQLEIIHFLKYIGCKANVIKLQEIHNDDGNADAIVEIISKKEEIIRVPIEVRRKGFPNHSGRTLHLFDGWDTYSLRNGIWINEITLRKHLNNDFFIYIVNITNGYVEDKRFAVISKLEMKNYLNQPLCYQKSTNTGRLQSVKTIPINTFEKIK